GVGERLFDVDVLAGLQRVDRYRLVPVIGRGDDHGVDVAAVEHLTVIGKDGGLAVRPRARALGASRIGVADGDDVDAGQTGGLLHYLLASCARSDQTDRNAIAGPRLRGKSGARDRRADADHQAVRHEFAPVHG